MRRAAGVILALVTAAGIVAAAQPDDPASRAALARAETTTVAPSTLPPTTTTDPLTVPVTFRGELDQLMAESPPESCLVVSVAGQRVYSRLADQPLLPASAMKLVTAAAALDLIGAGERFATQVFGTAPIVDGRVDGDLWLVGGGDPVLATSNYVDEHTRPPHVATRLEGLADQLVAAGLRSVAGNVFGDERRYDTMRFVPSWKQGYLDDHESGPLGALMVNRGFASLRPLEPAPEPAVHAADVLVWLLEVRGVDIAGIAAGSGGLPADAQPLAQVASPTQAEIVAHMLRMSDNTVAELQLKEIGLRAAGEPTTPAGAAAALDALARRGIDNTSVVVIDGSGLDRANRLTCDVLTRLLDAEGRPSLIAQGLSVAGRVGTLSRRWLETPVEGRLVAKSGSIDGVISLAGYFDGPVSTITFSYIQNGDHPLIDGFARRDRLGEILARHADAGTLFGGEVRVPRPEPLIAGEIDPATLPA